jgi:predicted esterase
MSTAHTIATGTHGRYLVSMPPGDGPHPWLLGFHGYGECAEHHMTVLEALDPETRWGRVSVQALHRFYTRAEDVVASWMTREDRKLAIADNLAYVAAVAAAVTREHPVQARPVITGFSQGAAMAYRAALAVPASGLIVLAGDVPPDVAPDASRLPRTLIGRGVADGWYTAEKMEADLALLGTAGVRAEVCEFQAGHVWDPAMIDAARRFLASY